MEGVAILVNVGILYTSYGLGAYSLISLIKLIYNYFKTKDKALVKNSLKKTAIVTVIALLLFYLIYFAGEYRKLDLSNETARQLLNVDITSIESGDCYLEITKEQSNEVYRVFVRKYRVILLNMIHCIMQGKQKDFSNINLLMKIVLL